jgi:hypothetical protein
MDHDDAGEVPRKWLNVGLADIVLRVGATDVHIFGGYVVKVDPA